MKEYEIEFQQKIFNPHIIAILLISCIVFLFLFYPIISPKEKIVNNSPVIETKTIIKYQTIIITPSIDGKIYYAQEHQNGTRKINNVYSYYTKPISGQTNLKVSCIVYGYLILPYITIMDWRESERTWVKANPNINNKFIFVFFNMGTDNIIGGNGAIYKPEDNKFSLKINNFEYYPISNYPKEIQIKELDNTHNYYDTLTIEPFGYQRYYSKSKEYRNNAGITTKTYEDILAGESNSMDGYFIFEIPIDTDEKDIIFNVNLIPFGYSGWRLSPEEK